MVDSIVLILTACPQTYRGLEHLFAPHFYLQQACTASTWCEAAATCDKITTPCSGSTPVNKGSETSCSGDAASCNAATCCEAFLAHKHNPQENSTLVFNYGP